VITDNLSDNALHRVNGLDCTDNQVSDGSRLAGSSGRLAALEPYNRL
jgi:hypothetical protein